jgi:hypothetical protein
LAVPAVFQGYSYAGLVQWGQAVAARIFESARKRGRIAEMSKPAPAWTGRGQNIEFAMSVQLCKSL